MDYTDGIGVHSLIVFEVQDPISYDLDRAMKMCHDIIQKFGLTVVNGCKYIFGNESWTFLYLLKESHFAVHTYPEVSKISVDFYSCKNYDVSEFMREISQVFIGKQNVTLTLKL